MSSSATEIARLLLDAGAVSLRPEQPFRLASGMLSPIYCDNRLLLGHVATRETISDALAAVIEHEIVGTEVIAGIATGGIAWAAWVAERLKFPMAYIRSSAKSHGRGQQVEGGVQTGQRVVLIEDLVSTGGSVLQGIAAMRDHGAIVAQCCVIFTYGMVAARDNFAAAGVQLISLTNLEALLAAAVADELITPEQQTLIADWAIEPATWGKRAGFEE